uniref:C2H2-type domain-containing protein n=1 Tax=Meloidogyne hapla TaxID=6305 RepID=A0A1I8BIQ9_MELHA
MLYHDQPHQHQHKQNSKRDHNDNTTPQINETFSSITQLSTPASTLPPNFSSGIFPLQRFHSPALLFPLLALRNLTPQIANSLVQPANQTTNSSIFPQLPTIQQKQQEILQWIQAIQQQHQYLTRKSENNNIIANNIIKNETNVIKKFDFADISSCVDNNQKHVKVYSEDKKTGNESMEMRESNFNNLQVPTASSASIFEAAVVIAAAAASVAHLQAESTTKTYIQVNIHQKTNNQSHTKSGNKNAQAAIKIASARRSVKNGRRQRKQFICRYCQRQFTKSYNLL